METEKEKEMETEKEKEMETEKEKKRKKKYALVMHITCEIPDCFYIPNTYSKYGI